MHNESTRVHKMAYSGAYLEFLKPSIFTTGINDMGMEETETGDSPLFLPDDDGIESEDESESSDKSEIAIISPSLHPVDRPGIAG